MKLRAIGPVALLTAYAAASGCTSSGTSETDGGPGTGGVSPGSGSNGGASGPAFSSLGGYKLSSGSPAINAGISIANNGGTDFWGTTLYVGAADVGAYEAP